jgi:hypothetical protein
METISRDDLILINDLSSRAYTGNKLLSKATRKEYNRFFLVKKKLKQIAKYFSSKYIDSYGPFDVSISSGNPISVGGTELNNVWSGIFKGASNKQYAAQISFVMNREKPCLNVGFYFGAASGHSITKADRKKFEQELNNLGIVLSGAIKNDASFGYRYNELFDFGFMAYSYGNRLNAEEWSDIISLKARNSRIVAEIYPNDFGIIENSTIDSFVSQVMFLMGAIREARHRNRPILVKPLTPEEAAKRAERLAQIGNEGELFAMKYEQERLKNLGIKSSKYPLHTALDSMNDGYDILSIDKNSKEIFIEVKTTTRTRSDSASRYFFISNNEVAVFSSNKRKYKLYRVYDIKNQPSIDELDLKTLNLEPDGFVVKY